MNQWQQIDSKRPVTGDAMSSENPTGENRSEPANGMAGEHAPTEAGTKPDAAAPHGSSEASNASDTTDGLAPDASALAAALAEVAAVREQLRDQALRAQAEIENIRRRAQRDVENAHRFGIEKFCGELLPVIDSLEKAVDIARRAEGTEAGAIAEGVELSLRLFVGALAKVGVAQIDPMGAPFDPQQHEAMAMVPNPHAEPNSVMDVMQKGYLLNGRLVRAAKVVVSKAPA
jgi:molecular chaperone GrpE